MKEFFDAFPFVGAFLGGLLSFLSPCVLPLVPSYVSFITGVSFEDLTAGADRKRVRSLTIKNSLFFIAGFSFVFISLGASFSSIGALFLKYQDGIRIAGGILIIIFGLFVSGILKLNFLLKDKHFRLHGKPVGYAGTFLVGITFAAGWTPCIGPILGTILLYASSQGSFLYGLELLTIYSLGLAIPFFISSFTINTFLSYAPLFYRFMRVIMISSGLLLIIFGIMLLTNRVRELSSLIPDLGF